MKQTTRLKKLIKRGVVILPGAWDTLSAKMVEKMGFKAVYMTGMGVSLTLIGRPDLGYINQTEMLEAARHITDVVNIPLIADIDDGFGNPLDVQRTIELCQKIGVAGVHMEDMERPKRCAHLGGAKLGPSEVMVNKIKAAVEARYDPDFLIIARTDNYEGIDEVIRRAKLYAEAGADMIMPLALHTKKDFERLSKSVAIPLLDAEWGGGSSPQLTLAECEQLNCRIQMFALEGFAQAYKSQLDILKQLKTIQRNKNKAIPLGNSVQLCHDFEYIAELKHDEEIQEKYFPKR